jgi:cell division protease FtsH
VSIIPRGRAGGYTRSLPLQDKSFQRRSELVDSLAQALGGRTAEEIVFGDPSTGAYSDIEQATEMARSMVMEHGMSDKVGPMRYGTPKAQVFLGRDYNQSVEYSDEVAAMIDSEIRKLITQAHEEARAILLFHRDGLDRIADALLERETLYAKDIAEILSDVPKWEHAANGSMRIQAPKGEMARGGIAAASTSDGGAAS